MYKNRKAIKALLAFYAIILIVMICRAPSFFTFENATDILLNTSTTAIAAMGMLCVLLVGDIDVSVGAVLAACCTTTGILAKAGLPMIVVILGSLAVGLLLGVVNGLVVTMLKLDAIVATLGLLSIYRGLLIIITKGSWINGLPAGILKIGQGKWFGIPIPVYISIVIVALMWFILNRTEWGRNFYAVGSNKDSARLSGINVKLTRIIAFAVCGIMVGLAAVIYTTRFGGIQSNTGKGWEMTLISSAVVGGASTVGGEGDVAGVFLGALLVSALGTVLVFFGIDALWEQAVQGLIIFISVASYAIDFKKVKAKLTKGGRKA
ncbi:ABC transporter permease [Bariatricus massiliensis]|uniref:Autoinducer 2 import system permease protein LsrC n=1 Tax=Bariatricus massiliensis TaxID=1745713 RepID=A0ABS8DLH5_9FIRM|nr:ABC transporter permease [Bariatricus massiliensis]MCB7303186.1 ABC transporter permease [Bariatricus massiliensis]MCB7376637.1 ABC transporter permease [Bariatricus massiliensis]MCB7389295.1 ABC transporter permease [Bariatricus massiliensis]MCB7413425.1 ABC transporter permease [Bariatricus massiliensis]MCQ5252060.1 ABC transporter permease [Bariatricus massiliensis]